MLIENLNQSIIKCKKCPRLVKFRKKISLEKRKEFILEDLRAERNRLITQTDWWANSDLTMTQEQMDYRQALRDITETYSSLEEVIWPELEETGE